MNNFKLLKGYKKIRFVNIEVGHLSEDEIAEHIQRMRRIMMMSSGIPQRFLNPPVTQVEIDIRLPENNGH
jgi:hypothetical protein